MKKIITVTYLIVTCVILWILQGSVYANTEQIPFMDVSTSSWYYNEVKTAYDAGIMEGKTSSTFDPNANMSRAEFVTVLCRLSEETYEGKGTSLSFADTDKNAWYADYIAWGVEAEMVKGLPENKFAPNQAVSRQEMAVFIDRFISYMNIDLIDNSKIDSFFDKTEVADYAVNAVETMRISGIITGDQNGNFNPTDNTSRAEVATVITRILPFVTNDGGSTNPIIPNITGEFILQEGAGTPLPYYIYIPDDYDTSVLYPMVIYSRDNGEMSINTVDVLFSHQDSPVHDSIVVVPNTITNSDSQKIDELVYYLKNHYSVSNEQIYMISLNDKLSTYLTWQMLIENPNTISAVIFVHGISATLGTNSAGQSVLLDDVAYSRLPEELKDISISIVHCLDDNRPIGYYLDKKYGIELYSALAFSGFNNVCLTEVNGYPDIYDTFINESDMTQLEWLFAQRRATN